MRHTFQVSVLAILSVLLLPPGVALADAVDGHWCHKDGRRLHVDGRKMVIPSGKRLTADYHRHGFTYVIPPGDKGAGGKVTGAQQGEYVLHVRPAGGGLEVWGRCKKGVS